MSFRNETSTSRNIVWSGAESFFFLFSQFFVMKVIIHELGTSALGVWSVVISSVQLTGFLGMGMTSGFGRFLSIAYAQKNMAEMESVFSVIISGALPIFAASAVILYVPIYYGMRFVLHDDALAEAYQILPFSLMCFVAQTLSGSFQSALISVGAGAHKSQVAILGCTLQALLSLYIVGSMDLLGLVLAQITNYLFQATFSYLIITMRTGIRLRNIIKISPEHFRKIIVFGVKVQATSLLWTAFEISLRFIMAHFGGPSAAGIYEIAYKIASQPRILVYNACQNLLPVFVAKWGSDKISFESIYIASYSRAAAFALTSFAGIMMLSPFVSYVMLGEVNNLFLLFALLTSLAMVCHIFAISSEIAAIAAGVVRYNVLGTLTAFLSIVVLGSVLGLQFGSYGVSLSALCSAAAAASIPVVIGTRIFRLSPFPNLGQVLKDLASFLSISRILAKNRSKGA